MVSQPPTLLKTPFPSATPSEVEDAASQLGINLRSIQALHHPGIQALHPGIQALHPDIQALHPDIQALPETGDTDRQAARHTVPENTAVFENTTVSENATVSVDTGEQLLVDTQEPGGASVNPDATRSVPTHPNPSQPVPTHPISFFFK